VGLQSSSGSRAPFGSVGRLHRGNRVRSVWIAAAIGSCRSPSPKAKLILDQLLESSAVLGTPSKNFPEPILTVKRDDQSGSRARHQQADRCRLRLRRPQGQSSKKQLDLVRGSRRARGLSGRRRIPVLHIPERVRARQSFPRSLHLPVQQPINSCKPCILVNENLLPEDSLSASLLSLARNDLGVDVLYALEDF
jgi:hypothetical protein